MSVTLMVEFKAKPGKSAKLRKLVKSWVPSTKKAQGCRSMKVFRHPTKKDCVVSLEEWSSKAAHDRYVKKVLASGAMDSPEMKVLSGKPKEQYFKAV